MCRKILLHVAVDRGLSPKDDKGRAPSFHACIEHLKTTGLVTPPMEPWVTRIKEVGNDGAHELKAISVDDARLVARFTEQLLVLTYEMADALTEFAPPPANHATQ